MKVHKPDYVLMLAFIAILVFGVVMLSSVSSAIAYDRFQDNYYYLKRQIMLGVIPGLVLFYYLSRVDYHRWRKLAFPFLLISILLLVLVLIPGVGVGIGGAKRWINVGGFTFQPSEAVKLTFLIYLASWLAHRGRSMIKDFSYGLLPFLTLVGLIALLMIMQPDVGTMIIIVMISMVVYFVAGARWQHLLAVGLSGLGVLVVLIKIAPYRAARLAAFLRPEEDPLGIGYHINQALLAIGSGGLLGMGLGASRQKHLYLPEVIGDSIFAIIAEELGFILVVCLILAYLVIILKGLNIARNAPDNFGKYLATGITAWIGLQAYLNMAAMTALTPLTGLPLPFISYGSSATIIAAAAMGILVNISRQTKESRIKKLIVKTVRD